jgi:hypothetical protein
VKNSWAGRKTVNNQSYQLGAGVHSDRQYIPFTPVVEFDWISTCNTKPNISIKPQTFDGRDDFVEYLSQFKILVELQRKSLYLASSLVSNARSVLTKLNEDQTRDLNSLVKVFNNALRLGREIRNWRISLKENGESLSELAQSVKKLIRKAYPSWPLESSCGRTFQWRITRSWHAFTLAGV